MTKSEHIPVILFSGETISLWIYEERPHTLEVNHKDAVENGESPYQLKEGCIYEYLLPDGFIPEDSALIRRSRIAPSRGRIHTNNYVGEFTLFVYREEEPFRPVGKVSLEIRSVKTDYRRDYRLMLEDITAKCTDLLLRQSSPVSQTLTIDMDCDPQTLYQRFAFVESLIRSESFADALHRIQSNPVTRWEQTDSTRSTCRVRRVNPSVMRQIATASNRVTLPTGHPLKSRFDTLPNTIYQADERETTDIPENRFIRYVLETFLQFTLSIGKHPKAGQRLRRETNATAELLENFICMPVLKGISRLDILPLNSPVLQRKEGYREVLQAWFMFDMAARLVWRGGEDVYQGGKRDVAVLYEYWLFFRLLELIEEVFRIKSLSTEHLIQPTTEHTLELTLRQGNLKMVDGVFEAHHRKFHLVFCYNRTFERVSSYPSAGSWTRRMRPDYTLSIWPDGLTEQEAEEQEEIVHLHFDAKYKIENFKTLLEDRKTEEGERDDTKEDYKRVDFLKMHAYKDAIRRTAGAFILYPGTEEDTYQSFHEILPGVGAFCISPSQTQQAGLKQFLEDVVTHLCNRTSQRSLFSYHTYKTFEEKPGPAINDPLPTDKYREFPKTTYVLVGYYKDEPHLQWILKNRLYNLRTDNYTGSLNLSREITGAKYLLLHGKGETVTGRIYRLDAEGPRVISKTYMKELSYPSPQIKPYYIGYKLKSESPVDEEFDFIRWDIRNLPGYRPGRQSAQPFVVTLEDLMRSKS